ncbi:MAG: OmpA family protein [Elusimicrobia bacterium]|nr:OmpA family protein [Elusimicrobiota bacterium]
MKKWIGIFLVLLIGCAKKSLVKKDGPAPDAETVKQEDIELPLRGKEFSPLKELGIVYFDLDAADLKPEMIAVTQKNAEFLKTHPELEARLDGHCDERGTTEYNLALGQRRAGAIRAYYKGLGVAGNRMGTQSWGEEKPACAELTEECYDQNRRVETWVRTKEKPVKDKKKKVKTKKEAAP